MSDFFNSVVDKAQSALGSSTLSQHLPASIRPSTGPSPSGPPSKNLTLDQIQHQFRQIQQSYSSTSPIQKIITAEKGLALDYETLSRDAKAQSKELYTWGQSQPADVKDVSDRLGFLHYIAGELSKTLSAKLESARTPLKELRDNDAALSQKRNVRAGLENQIARIERGKERGYEKRVAELREQLAKAESDGEPAERQHEILVRRALKDSERERFQAFREYGEKLSLLAQAAEAVVAVLPPVPPSPSQPYTRGEETGSIRAALQHALDDWKPGNATLPVPAGAKLDRSHTRSFGETHAEELQQINTNEHRFVEGSPPVPDTQQASTPGINPASVTLPGPADTEAKVLSVTPTVAETGVPVSGGTEGPGPSSGSLLDIRSSKSGTGPTPNQEARGSSGPPNPFESAEEEKRRLEREERER
ncbi:Eisosome component PIL1-domain-containing protein, partial [Lactifluus volemus]